MSGHSVGDDVAESAVRFGQMTNQYVDTRVYLYRGDHYFIPARIWRAIEQTKDLATNDPLSDEL
jgi:hypothetical protein